MCNLALFYLKIKKINHAKILTMVTAGLFVVFLISQGRLWFASNYRKVHYGIKKLKMNNCNNYFVESLNQTMTKPAIQTSLNWSTVHLLFGFILWTVTIWNKNEFWILVVTVKISRFMCALISSHVSISIGWLYDQYHR